jgi:adenylylsulfate kinase
MGLGLRILIMGLPGAGKTTLAEALKEKLGDALWLNADKIREIHKDWDFSYAGRLRQATRMKRYADVSEDPYIIADFVCPLPEMRSIFDPHITIWMDTIKSGRFEDTNKAFVVPEEYDLRVVDWNTQVWVNLAINQIRAVQSCLE